MDARELRDTLARLHDELGRSRQLDAGSRELLERLAGDIEALLQRDSSEPQDALAALGERLRGAIERFEEEHPALTTAIGRVADALASLGI